MIPQDEFIRRRSQEWNELDHAIGSGGALHHKDGPVISRIASLYRSLCNDLTRAESSRYTPDLLDYLHGLAGRTHNVLYGAKPMRVFSAAKLLFVDFPIELRRNWRLFVISCALFLVPWAIGLFGALTSSSFAGEVLPRAMLDQMADAYSHGFSAGRDGGQDAQMAGFYVYNNVGIAFRCFATGILFGVGTIFFLIYNGLMIGTVTGYVMTTGGGTNIWTFMCGHGPWEITAIFISGGAGLQMGYSLIATEGLTRFASMKRHLRSIVAQVVGAAAMLTIAAAIEGFWSPSALPNEVKWAFGAINLTIVVLFLSLGGRGATSSMAGPGTRMWGSQ